MNRGTVRHTSEGPLTVEENPNRITFWEILPFIVLLFLLVLGACLMTTSHVGARSSEHLNKYDFVADCNTSVSVYNQDSTRDNTDVEFRSPLGSEWLMDVEHESDTTYGPITLPDSWAGYSVEVWVHYNGKHSIDVVHVNHGCIPISVPNTPTSVPTVTDSPEPTPIYESCSQVGERVNSDWGDWYDDPNPQFPYRQTSVRTYYYPDINDPTIPCNSGQEEKHRPNWPDPTSTTAVVQTNTPNTPVVQESSTPDTTNTIVPTNTVESVPTQLLVSFGEDNTCDICCCDCQHENIDYTDSLLSINKSLKWLIASLLALLAILVLSSVFMVIKRH